MSKILDFYKKSFIKRFDKVPFVPYLSNSDFDGLEREKNTFINSKGTRLSYFRYHYLGYREDVSILFLPGIGPGHAAYMREIELLASHSFDVITIDYTGCGESEGDSLMSINEPTRDVCDLLNYLRLKRKLIVIGHSLGAYTTINVMKRRPELKKAVVISGFINIETEMMGFAPFKFLFKPILKFEEDTEKEYFDLSQLEYLRKTDNDFVFLHSKDDKMVSYKKNFEVIKKLNNPSLRFISVNKRGHNPNYTEESVKYMNETFKVFNKLKSDDERREFMKQRSALLMTNQDLEIIDQAFDILRQD